MSKQLNLLSNRQLKIFCIELISPPISEKRRGSEPVASSFKANQPNTIAIVADGNTITPYINGQALITVKDSTYSQGQIGLIADDEGNPTEVAYSNARL